jgi:hypothetical protein
MTGNSTTLWDFYTKKGENSVFAIWFNVEPSITSPSLVCQAQFEHFRITTFFKHFHLAASQANHGLQIKLFDNERVEMLS